MQDIVKAAEGISFNIEEWRYMLKAISNSLYISSVEYLISEGLEFVETEYIHKHVSYVLSKMDPDGGFSGRISGSDIYYTDFALRTLAACGWQGEQLSAVASYVRGQEKRLTGIVDCFNFLNCVRMLDGWGISISVDVELILHQIETCRTSDFGFRKGLSDSSSIYAAFLAALCFDMLGTEDQMLLSYMDSITGLSGIDGGFPESEADAASQLNSTAAAVSLIAYMKAGSPDDISRHLQYIAGAQKNDGGFVASGNISCGDLLSSFSAVAALAFLGNLEMINLRQITRFLKSVETPGGGFRACLDDPEADVEYTYYGVGILGILRTFLQDKRQILNRSPG